MQEAIRLWRDAGAEIEGESRVRVPMGLARQIVQALRACRIHPARAQSRALRHDRRPCHRVRAAYGPPFVSDAERGRRYGTLEDFQNFVKLTYLTPWLHHSGGTVCEPTDLPVNKRHLDMLYAHMTLSDKPFMGSVTTAARAADSIEMCRILFGADFVDSHCVILGNVNVNSPLVLDGEASRVIRTYAAANQAPVCVPFILGGAMGPVTTAGGLAQCFAEARLLRGAGPARAARLARNTRQFPVIHVAEERCAHFRHAGAATRLLCDRAACAPPRRSAALRRQPVRVQGTGRSGRVRECQFALAGVHGWRQFRPALGRLARGRARHVI